MKEYELIKFAIFGFKDKATGDTLREFFKKHTGRDVDFNNIEHYNDGFKLLKLSIPLESIGTVGITEANYRPTPTYKKFHCSVDDFIDWYENEYLLLKDVEIIKHIPHASLDLPKEYSDFSKGVVFGKGLLIDNYKMTDLFIDKLFENIDGIEIIFPYSRIYCDVERNKDNSKEPMFKYGQGYEYRKSITGNTYNRHFSFNGVDPDRNVLKHYDEHHKRLTDETRKILSNNKKILILDLHSFSDEQANAVGNTGPYPDICIGVNDPVQSEPYLKVIIKRIKEKGYSYKINFPYKGSIFPYDLTEEELKNVCSIMIEVNKRLYL